MLLSRVGQLIAAFDLRVLHLIGGQLEPPVEHGRGDVEISGHQYRLHARSDEGLECPTNPPRLLVFQGEDGLQLAVDGAEDGLFHVLTLLEGDVHDGHEPGGADHDLFPTDGCHQAAGLVVVHGVHPAEEAALDMYQVAEQLGQPAARRLDHGGGTAGDPFQGSAVEGLDALGLDAAHREQVVILEQDVGVPFHGQHPVPTGQSHRAAEPFGQTQEGLAIGQHPGQGRTGGEGHRQAPEDAFRVQPSRRCDEGEEDSGNEHQGHDHLLDALGAVRALDLGTELLRRPRLLGEGTASLPFVAVQGHTIGGGRQAGGLAGLRQPLLPVV